MASQKLRKTILLLLKITEFFSLDREIIDKRQNTLPKRSPFVMNCKQTESSSDHSAGHEGNKKQSQVEISISYLNSNIRKTSWRLQLKHTEAENRKGFPFTLPDQIHDCETSRRNFDDSFSSASCLNVSQKQERVLK